VCSPDKNDVKIARDLVIKKKILDTGDNPNKYVKVRNFKYVVSLNKLWEEAQQPVADGGFPGLRDEYGELKFHRTVFEELIPDHFGRRTDSHKRSCMCTTCLNGDMLMRDYVSWQKFAKKTLETQILVADLNK
jgi:hypothetical protein